MDRGVVAAAIHNEKKNTNLRSRAIMGIAGKFSVTQIFAGPVS